MSDRLLTVKEAADRFNCSPLTVYRMINNGKLKAIKLSRQMIRISEEDIHDKLKQKVEKSGEDDKRVIRLGGIWKGIKITDDDIKESRQAMLKKLEEKF